MGKSGLTAVFVDKARRPGKYYDQFGLYLKVEDTGRRYWEQRFTVRRRQRTVGIGPYPEITLKAARDVALEHRRIVVAGGDPIEHRRRPKIPTFEKAARSVLELHGPNWSHPRQVGNWIRSMEQYVFPRLGRVPVCDISSRDVMAVLKPIWNELPDTARRIRQRIGAVMKWAIAEGHRSDNPAGHALVGALPNNRSNPKHYPALPHNQVSAALAQIRACPSPLGTKLVFEFLVLTAVRSGEARGARWSEFDIGSGMWTVPASRMKTRTEHRVPLSRRALAILHVARQNLPAGELVFPSKTGRVIRDAAVSKVLRDLSIPAVPHGFRSSFRDWCGDTAVPRELAEACLAHTVANKVEAAYARTDLYNRRIQVMEDWAQYAVHGPVAPAQQSPSGA